MSNAQPVTWPLNAWYVACTPDEIDGKPLGRQICGQRMVFVRRGDGKVAAMEDFCPHRGTPLSLGFVQDGMLVCDYHGLQMAAPGVRSECPGKSCATFPRSASL